MGRKKLPSVSPKNHEDAQRIKDYVENILMNRPTAGTVIQQLPPFDELLKYKQFLDSGIITQEEFNAKKNNCLGYEETEPDQAALQPLFFCFPLRFLE